MRETNRALGELSERLLTLQEDERQRIAAELHDSTAQHLAAIGLNAMNLKARSASDADTQKLWEDVEVSLEEATRELRAFTYLLHPMRLERDGLDATLRRYVEGFAQRTGLSVTVSMSAGIDRSADRDDAIDAPYRPGSSRQRSPPCVGVARLHQAEVGRQLSSPDHPGRRNRHEGIDRAAGCTPAPRSASAFRVCGSVCGSSAGVWRSRAGLAAPRFTSAFRWRRTDGIRRTRDAKSQLGRRISAFASLPIGVSPDCPGAPLSPSLPQPRRLTKSVVDADRGGRSEGPCSPRDAARTRGS